ncbi:MAG: GTPase [Planctomycetota bacterium]|nr:GTPase [Planctomycetota bacterium]
MTKPAQATAALQSPPGRGGIAVIVLAGDRAGSIIDKIFRPLRSHHGGDGTLQLGHIISGGQTIDEAIVCRRGRAIELNIHGGPQVARATMQLLADCGADVRPAPRAAVDSLATAHPDWNNPAVGREMLECLCLASSSLAVVAVAAQWSAGLSRLIAGPDPTAEALRSAADGLRRIHRILHPAEIVLAGPPNVGKSALTNAMVGRQVSIVSDIPGTTRDWVRERALLDGLPIQLTDTAGLWDKARDIDAEAVQRARRRVDRADLVLLLEAGENFNIPSWLHAKKLIRVAAKCDTVAPSGSPDVSVSSTTGEGLAKLKRLVLDAIGLGGFDPAEPMALTQRQADLLNEAADALGRKDNRRARALLDKLLQG